MSITYPLTTSEHLDHLYVEHHSWLYSVLCRRMGNAFDAADLAQDTFLRLFLKPIELDSDNSARAYLNKVSKHLCVDLWRKRELERAWLEQNTGLVESHSISAEQQNLILETLQQIDQMLRELPQKVATAFLLSQLKGMTYKQIAEVLSVSERMVKKYMAQALFHCAMLEVDLDY